MRMPDETAANRGRRLTAKLAAMLASTTPSTTRLCRAGGMMMARNMPYNPTERALTSRAGSTLPITTPRPVPMAQPGMATVMAP